MKRLTFKALAYVIVFAVVFVDGDHAFAAVQCSGIFGSAQVTSENTVSIKKAILDLANLRVNIDRAKAEGSNSLVLSALTAGFTKKEKELSEYVVKIQLMSRTELNELVRQEISNLQKNKQPDQESESLQLSHKAVAGRDAIEFGGINAVLNRVEPGTFRMGERKGFFDRRPTVKIDRAFELMSTTTTNILWSKVVRLGQQKLPGQYDLGEGYLPDHDLLPVTGISHNMAVEWLDIINRLSQRNEPALAFFIDGHKDGDVYRLPTNAEWEFVLRNRGKSNDLYFFGNDKNKLKDYAWIKENSDMQIHPVAQKLPLVVDGKEFYDMYGNVDEWVQDWYSEGVRTIRTGHYYSESHWINSHVTSYFTPQSNTGTSSFRFVREVRP